MHPVFSHCVMTCGSFQTPYQFNLWKQHILDGWVVDLMLKLSKTGWKSASDSRHYITFFFCNVAVAQVFSNWKLPLERANQQQKKFFHFNMFSVFLLSVFFWYFLFIYLFFKFALILFNCCCLLYIGFQCFNAIMNWTCHELNMGNQPEKDSLTLTICYAWQTRSLNWNRWSNLPQLCASGINGTGLDTGL